MMNLRRLRRISEGKSKAVPSSTKIAKCTESPKRISKGTGYRTNRFASC